MLPVFFLLLDFLPLFLDDFNADSSEYVLFFKGDICENLYD